MDEELVEAVDNEARRMGSDRSKVVRSALERFLSERRRRAREAAYVDGYRKRPLNPDEVWEQDEWPES